jgi:hypothetical protein
LAPVQGHADCAGEGLSLSYAGIWVTR